MTNKEALKSYLENASLADFSNQQSGEGIRKLTKLREDKRAYFAMVSGTLSELVGGCKTSSDAVALTISLVKAGYDFGGNKNTAIALAQKADDFMSGRFIMDAVVIGGGIITDSIMEAVIDGVDSNDVKLLESYRGEKQKNKETKVSVVVGCKKTEYGDPLGVR